MNKKYFYLLILFLTKNLNFYAEQVCNGHLLLCNRRYNEVVFPATHNAQSYKGPSSWTGWLVSVQNQDKTITKQLEAGIRAMKVPLHFEGRGGAKIVTACHGIQVSDLYAKAPRFTPQWLIDAIEHHPSYYDKAAQPFKNIVQEIRIFLDNHPQEVFTLFLEDHTQSHEAIVNAFCDAGMVPERYIHVQDKIKPWPTLGEMIKSGKRVIVFINSQTKTGSLVPWLHQFDDFIWQTQYSFGSVHDLKEDIKDPALRNAASKTNFNNRFMLPKNKIAVVQHFVTPSANSYTLYFGGTIADAQKVNARDILLPRLQALYKKAQVPLNFIWVDFFEYGDLFDIVNQLNGVGKYVSNGPLFTK